MSVTVRADFDVDGVIAGFNRIEAASAATHKKLQTDVAVSDHQWATYTKSTWNAQKATNGMSSEVGGINPKLAAFQHGIASQVPGMQAWAGAVSKGGVAVGALAATAGALAKMAYTMSEVSKKTIDATTHFGQFIDMARDLGKDQTVLDWFTKLTGSAHVDANELAQQQNPPKWTQKENNGSAVHLDEVKKSLAQQEKMKSYTSGMGGINSVTEANRLLEVEMKRIEGLDQLRALTAEEAAASQAYQEAVIARSEEITNKIEALRDIKDDMAEEDKNRWIEEINHSDDAAKAIDERIKKFHLLYNTEQLTDKQEKSLLTEINMLRAKHNQKLDEEKQKRIELRDLRQQELADMRKMREEADRDRAAALRDQILAARGGEGGGGNINGPGMDAGMQRKARARASQELKRQVQNINEVFADEMDKADQAERLGIDVGDQRKEIKQRRNQAIREAKAGRGEQENDELGGLAKQARDQMIEANGKHAAVGEKMVDLVKAVADTQADQIKADDDLSRRLSAVEGIVNANRVNARQRTQQAGRR